MAKAIRCAFRNVVCIVHRRSSWECLNERPDLLETEWSIIFPMSSSEAVAPEPADQKPKFTFSDFMAYGENQDTIRVFLYFATAMAVLPIGTFFATQFTLRRTHGTDGSIGGCIASVTVILALMAAYAIRAYQEEKRDYFAENPSDTRPVWGITAENERLEKKKTQ